MMTVISTQKQLLVVITPLLSLLLLFGNYVTSFSPITTTTTNPYHIITSKSSPTSCNKCDDDDDVIICNAISRRQAIVNSGNSLLLGSVLESNPTAAVVPDYDDKKQGEDGGGGSPQQQEEAEGLIADLPMIRLKLPQSALGREYVALQLKIDGKGPYDFMVDTGLTTEMITPHLLESLKISPTTADGGNTRIRGIGAGGKTTFSNYLVPLKGVSLCCGKFNTRKKNNNNNGRKNQQPMLPDSDEDLLPLPNTLTAIVTDFPQEHIDPKHDPIEGMLGMEVLSLFDVDFDFPAGRIRLWEPGTAAKATTSTKQQQLVEIPAVVINESGLYGIRITSGTGRQQQQQPILGFIDCGATFSTVNWAAAYYLGLPTKNDIKAFENSPVISAIGIDGKPILLPTLETQLSYAGNPQQQQQQKEGGGGGGSGSILTFESPPKEWKAWDPIQLAIGDLPVFKEVLGDGIRPYEGPACLVGLDILSQRRVILETGKTRQRRLWVSPK